MYGGWFYKNLRLVSLTGPDNIINQVRIDLGGQQTVIRGLEQMFEGLDMGVGIGRVCPWIRDNAAVSAVWNEDIGFSGGE